MGETAIQTTDRTRMTAWSAAVTMAVALGAASAWASDVTVIGSTWQEQQAASSECRMPVEVVPTPQADASLSSDEAAEGPSFGPAESPLGPSGEPMDEGPCCFRRFSLAQCALETDWYAKFDYFCWKEQAHDVDSVDEHGALYTIGYMRRNGAKRFRAEVFTGTMNYTTGINWRSEDMGTITRYTGARTEFELLWDLNRRNGPPLNCFAGIGTRFWIRDIKDAQFDTGLSLIGHQETWVTLYPYLGIEQKWRARNCFEFFLSGRIGSTAWTYQSAASLGGPRLSPTACLTGQIEFGMYYEHLVTSVSFEAMTWGRSPTVNGDYQPSSQMYTTGVKVGLRY